MNPRIEVKVRHFSDRSALQLQWIDPLTGQRRTISARTSDEKEAEQARADHEYRLNNGLHVEPIRTGWDAFRSAFEDEYLSGKRPNTRTGYAATFDLFEEICSPLNLSSISSRTVSQFVASLRKLPGRKKGTLYAASTISVRLELLGAALAWAVSVGMLASVPEFPVVSVPRKRPQPVPVEWVDRLLRQAGADLQMRAYILCAWLAGLRRNEAYYLEWEQSEEHPYIDRSRRRIIFPAASCKAVEDQWVPLASELQASLDSLPGRSGPVFCFSAEPVSVGTRVRTLARLAGVRLTYRSLRRGFGCKYAARVPAQVLQRLMRHSSIETTLAYYASFEDAIEEAVLGSKCNSPDNTAQKNVDFSAEKRGSPTSSSSEDRPVEDKAA